MVNCTKEGTFSISLCRKKKCTNWANAFQSFYCVPRNSFLIERCGLLKCASYGVWKSNRVNPLISFTIDLFFFLFYALFPFYAFFGIEAIEASFPKSAYIRSLLKSILSLSWHFVSTADGWICEIGRLKKEGRLNSHNSRVIYSTIV